MFTYTCQFRVNTNIIAKIIAVGPTAPDGNQLLAIGELPLPSCNIVLIPNLNKGEFILNGRLKNNSDEEITIEVLNILGQTIYKINAKSVEGKINEQVILSNTLANGMYLLNLHSNAEHYVFHFVVER